MESVLKFARGELKKYYKKMTGADVCDIKLAVDLSLAEKNDSPKWDDKFRICVKEGKGRITGINARSVLEGVYRFLRELGCVFVRPGEDGEKIVKLTEKDCSLSMDVRPRYRYRTVAIEGANSLEDILNVIDWSMKNGFNSYFTQFRDSYTFFDRWYSHERNEYVVGKKLTDEQAAMFVEKIVAEVKKRGMLYHAVGHGWTCECLSFPSKGWYKIGDEEIPEKKRQYIAQLNGTRKFFRDVPLYSQLCYSNPDVRKLIADEVVSYIEKHSEIDYLHVWLGDNYNNYCECENCIKKIPTDWYFMILNEIDRKLTELKKDTKIIFLIYFELLWPARTVELNNPDRFVLMFAPITRTFTCGFQEKGKKIDRDAPLPEFTLNHIALPVSTEENLAFLFANRKTFHGDAFDFDYHLMWEPYKDLAGLQIASVIREDVCSLEKLGLNGLVSCQVQKVFMPHGFAMFVMGHMLEDPDVSFSKLKEQYFSALYGEYKDLCTGVLERIENSRCAAYLRNEYHQVDDEVAENLTRLRKDLSESADLIGKKEDGEKDPFLKKNLFYLRFYCELLCRYLDALIEKSRGGSVEAMDGAFEKMHKFLFTNEEKVSSVMDTFSFDQFAQQILHSDWDTANRGNP